MINKPADRDQLMEGLKRFFEFGSDMAVSFESEMSEEKKMLKEIVDSEDYEEKKTLEEQEVDQEFIFDGGTPHNFKNSEMMKITEEEEERWYSTKEEEEERWYSTKEEEDDEEEEDLKRSSYHWNFQEKLNNNNPPQNEEEEDLYESFISANNGDQYTINKEGKEDDVGDVENQIYQNEEEEGEEKHNFDSFVSSSSLLGKLPPI